MRGSRRDGFRGFPTATPDLMPSLLQKLLLDLKRRGDWILGELAVVEKGLPADFNTHRKEVVQRLTRAIAVVDHMLADPDLAWIFA